MKLYSLTFDTDQDFKTVRQIAKQADPNAIVYVNEGANKRACEVQSERAAQAISSQLKAKVEIIEYDVTAMHRK